MTSITSSPTIQVEQTFHLPWPVSTNSLWRAVKGRNILAKRAREWHDTASLELMTQRPIYIKGPVRLSFSLSSPTKRLFDLDNRTKIVSDLLVSFRVIEADDCSIVKEINISLGEGFVGVKVTVTPI